MKTLICNIYQKTKYYHYLSQMYTTQNLSGKFFRKQLSVLHPLFLFLSPIVLFQKMSDPTTFLSQPHEFIHTLLYQS